jgi:F0F1-type ATP synthase alpha subunit
LASYKETETFAYFGISNAYINRILFRGAKLERLLHQDFDEFLLTSEEQCIVLYAGMYGYLDEIDNEDINQYERVILNFFQNIESRSHILDIVDTLFLFSLTKETEKRLIEGLDFLTNYFSENE